MRLLIIGDIVSNLKDPDNYVNYIKSNEEFMDSVASQYEAVKGFRHEIKKIQKKIRSTSIKQLTSIRQGYDSGSNTDNSEYLHMRKVVVLEPEDLIFTLTENKIDGIVPNLVFEQKNEFGEITTQHMYMNQSFKPFLIYLCKTYDVIIYSRIKVGLLNQLLNQVKTMCPDAHFCAVLGANSCFNAKLTADKADRDCSSGGGIPPTSESSQNLSFVVKNIEKLVKMKGRENILFLDNNLYSYINYLDLYIPVPKFTGKENFSLFFLKFYLEDYEKGREPI